MVSPWRALAQPHPSAEYLAMLTYLPLRGYLQMARFFSYSAKVQKQLERTAGVIGYSFKANPLRNQYWTFSVWENDRALMNFVRTEPHASAMIAFNMGATTFTRWKLRGDDVPPRWNDALRRSQEDLNG
jgi:hypothetical protein